MTKIKQNRQKSQKISKNRGLAAIFAVFCDFCRFLSLDLAKNQDTLHELSDKTHISRKPRI